MEKREEKTPEEKSWDEKWRRDPLGSIIWAFVLIWTGVVLLLDNLGYLSEWLDSLSKTLNWDALSDLEVWSVIFLGAGLIFFFEVLLRVLIPAYRRSVTGTIIFAMILIGIGLSDIINWAIIWSLVIITIGLSLLLRGVTSKK
jgi:hypothetical protein